MLLAAGLGTRLKPLTDFIPKPLIPINGIPLIFYNLALLKKHGIREVVINLHHLGGQIQTILGDGKDYGFIFHYSFEPKILGTGGGVKRAESFLKNGPFFVLNADIIIDANLTGIMDHHRKNGSEATLVVKKRKKSDDFSPIFVDALSPAKKIVSFFNKPRIVRKAEVNFFTGIHVLNQNFFQSVNKNKKSCIIRHYYCRRLEKGASLGTYPLQNGYWNDLGTPERVAKTIGFFARNGFPLSYRKELEFLQKILDRKMAQVRFDSI